MCPSAQLWIIHRPERAAGRGGQHVGDAQLFERPNVGPVVDVAWGQPVAGPVAGQHDNVRTLSSKRVTFGDDRRRNQSCSMTISDETKVVQWRSATKPKSLGDDRRRNPEPGTCGYFSYFCVMKTASFLHVSLVNLTGDILR